MTNDPRDDPRNDDSTHEGPRPHLATAAELKAAAERDRQATKDSLVKQFRTWSLPYLLPPSVTDLLHVEVLDTPKPTPWSRTFAVRTAQGVVYAVESRKGAQIGRITWSREKPTPTIFKGVKAKKVAAREALATLGIDM